MRYGNVACSTWQMLVLQGEATSAEVESPVVSSQSAMPSATLEGESSIITADIPDSESSFMPSPEEMTETPSNFSKGVVFYMRNSSVVGVVLWNVFNRMPIARRVSCVCAVLPVL